MRVRVAFLLMLAVAFTVLPGCGRVWFVEFRNTASLDSWVTHEDYSIDTLGLVMDDEGIVTSPVAFNGDFTVTVVFELFVDSVANRAAFAIWLSDSQLAIADNYITNFARGLGKLSDEEYGVQDFCVDDLSHPYVVNLDAEYPGLNRNGTNTWKLFKDGDHVLITMNETTTVADFDISHYSDDIFFINLHGDLSGAGILRFKSVRVVYYDELLDG